ncbi:nuclear transport factor 2 family protein [Actinomadura barringtoniae]|uniref:Nuclear transport factor 2 family protein n=1 Tax=Actinomadura barringtoniae TaxID=1427535 RepID=A0A939TAG1_9ACTN|nr:nuclear transport factor 2 family protein [Actinomadura barringtoniae]MBO2452422.1 nuclear transport factor 2 family protein [Actinomadura barringtoniae]
MAETTETQIRELEARWAEAERTMDVEFQRALLDDDFRGVGPVGFILNKEQWLGRYGGGLKIQAFDFENIEVRAFGDTAVAIGTQVQEASHQDRPVNGRFRVTHVYLRREGSWRVIGKHISNQQQP